MWENFLDALMIIIVVRMEIVKELAMVVVVIQSAERSFFARINTAVESTPGKCDESLWDHVYNPSRLQIVDSCITITGTIDSIRAEKDGDLHIRLSVDSQYSYLINQANER